MVSAIVLAAGISSRMKTPKQLLGYRGRPLLRHVVETLLQTVVDQIIVVLGHEAETIAGVLTGLPVTVVVNNNYEEGLSSSLKAGVSALLTEGKIGEGSEGVLFVLSDQPLIKPDTVDLLVQHYRRVGGIVAPFYQGVRGNPVVFDRKFFSEFLSLSGDTGARQVIASHPEDVCRVEVSDRGVVQDVDTWADYCELLEAHTFEGGRDYEQ